LGFVTNRQDYVTDGPTDCPPARIRITLKALANFSPGFVLKPWVQKCKKKLFATLKGLRGFAVNNAGATPCILDIPAIKCLSLPWVAPRAEEEEQAAAPLRP
jgi:hypothetical protein